ncbi:uncharacterized protein LOC144100826 [Amblyomma americanum]
MKLLAIIAALGIVAQAVFAEEEESTTHPAPKGIEPPVRTTPRPWRPGLWPWPQTRPQTGPIPRPHPWPQPWPRPQPLPWPQPSPWPQPPPQHWPQPWPQHWPWHRPWPQPNSSPKPVTPTAQPVPLEDTVENTDAWYVDGKVGEELKTEQMGQAFVYLPRPDTRWPAPRHERRWPWLQWA